MDECFSLLRLWKAEKDLILYFNELNTYHDLLQGSLEDYDQEDKELLAIDIDNALTAISDRFSIEQTESYNPQNEAFRLFRTNRIIS